MLSFDLPVCCGTPHTTHCSHSLGVGGPPLWISFQIYTPTPCKHPASFRLVVLKPVCSTVPLYGCSGVDKQNLWWGVLTHEVMKMCFSFPLSRVVHDCECRRSFQLEAICIGSSTRSRFWELPSESYLRKVIVPHENCLTRGEPGCSQRFPSASLSSPFSCQHRHLELVLVLCSCK